MPCFDRACRSENELNDGSLGTISIFAGLYRSDEGAHEFSVHLRSYRVHVNSFPSKELSRVLNPVDSGRLHFNLLKSSRRQFVFVLVLFERTGDTTDPKENTLADLRKHLAPYNDVRDGETASGLEDTKGFTQDTILIGGEINYAVGNDDIDGVVGQGDVFDLTFEKLDVFNSGLALVFASKGQHFVRHVQAVGLAGWPHTHGRKQHVDASAGAKVEDRFAGVELGKCGRVAAAEGREYGLLWNLP